jgi:trk system potassium uptake protein TrkA
MSGILFRKKKQLAIIAGASRFGSRLAGLLSERGNDVIIIDEDRNSFGKLPDNFGGQTVEGDASDTSVLEAVRIGNAAVCIAATDDDSTNSLIAQIAGCIYTVPYVYARLNDVYNMEILVRSHIHIICPPELSVQEFNRDFTGSSGELS